MRTGNAKAGGKCKRRTREGQGGDQPCTRPAGTVDFAAYLTTYVSQLMILAGEIGPSDAEGATAPETLRQKDREELALWKEAGRDRPAHRRA